MSTGRSTQISEPDEYESTSTYMCFAGWPSLGIPLFQVSPIRLDRILGTMYVTTVVDTITRNAPSVGCKLRVSVKRCADLGTKNMVNSFTSLSSCGNMALGVIDS